MNTETALAHAADIVHHELPSHLGPQFTISHVTVDSFEFEDEEFNHLHVYLKPGHPKIEPFAMAKFSMDMEPRFTALGISSPPAISFGTAI